MVFGAVKVITKVSLKLKQFRRMHYLLNTKAAVLVYKNMILPMLEYGDIFLVGATAENRKRLQILQNKGYVSNQIKFEREEKGGSSDQISKKEINEN